MLEHWNDYHVAHLRGLQEPQEDESGRGETRSPTAALTPRRAREAHSEESTVPREAHPAPEPRHLSADAQTQAQSFPCPAHTEQSGHVLTAESAWSRLNIISADRTWRGLNLPCRQNLVRFKLGLPAGTGHS